ncbi:MAG: hypothetical protein HY791_04725 [Deltaproteobacteria bacterium]|nr:hypothetical protein [Deltaproteobacteria bacterium]
MEPALKAYLTLWVSFCVIAGAVAFRARDRIELLSSGYLELLSERWRVVLICIALLGICGMAPYTGDPTWDWFDAGFMGVLTYATAPFSVGVFGRSLMSQAQPARGIGRPSWASVFVAISCWMFSASWSYDLYILFRDGFYPVTWAANIPASSVLYASAGFLFSLDYSPDRGVGFAFTELDWPKRSAPGGFSKLVWYALPFVLIAFVGLSWFVYVELGM